jgi:uncharacterized protein YqeY
MYDRLKSDLRLAMAGRDTTAVRTIRTLISALDNAGAVPIDQVPEPVVGRHGDVPRRALDEASVRAILEAEAEERRSAIAEYEDLGLEDAAGTLRAEMEVVARYL